MCVRAWIGKLPFTTLLPALKNVLLLIADGLLTRVRALVHRSTSVLEEKLEELAEAIGKFGLVAATLTFGLQLTNSLLAQETGTSVLTLEYAREVTQYVVNAIAILVVAIPEGLPLAVTMALAFSMRRMLSDNNLVRHLYACETMATCTSICSDKTGTLTLNKMKVRTAPADLKQLPRLCEQDVRGGWMHTAGGGIR